MWSSSGAWIRRWLHEERGLKEEAVKRASLGWMEREHYLSRHNWGLPEEEGRSKIKIPRGLIIPGWKGGEVVRLRVRAMGEEVEGGRYRLVTGSSSVPTSLRHGEGREVAIVTESELDGYLLLQEAGDLCDVIPLGSAAYRPDKELWISFQEYKTVLLSLDDDGPGEEALLWWRRHLKRVELHPPILGKDPGEMRKAGVPIRGWVEIGIKLSREKRQDPSTEPRRGACEGREEVEAISPPPPVTGPKEGHLSFSEGPVSSWPEELQEEFEERASIMEYDGVLSRGDAEEGAYHLLKGRKGGGG